MEFYFALLLIAAASASTDSYFHYVPTTYAVQKQYVPTLYKAVINEPREPTLYKVTKVDDDDDIDHDDLYVYRDSEIKVPIVHTPITTPVKSIQPHETRYIRTRRSADPNLYKVEKVDDDDDDIDQDDLYVYRAHEIKAVRPVVYTPINTQVKPLQPHEVRYIRTRRSPDEDSDEESDKPAPVPTQYSQTLTLSSPNEDSDEEPTLPKIEKTKSHFLNLLTKKTQPTEINPVVQYSIPQSPVQYTIPQTPVQYSIPQTPVQYTIPQTPVQYSLPQAPVQYTIQQTPVQYSFPQTPVQYTIPQTPVQYTIPQTTHIHNTLPAVHVSPVEFDGVEVVAADANIPSLKTVNPIQTPLVNTLNTAVLSTLPAVHTPVFKSVDTEEIFKTVHAPAYKTLETEKFFQAVHTPVFKTFKTDDLVKNIETPVFRTLDTDDLFKTVDTPVFKTLKTDDLVKNVYTPVQTHFAPTQIQTVHTPVQVQTPTYYTTLDNQAVNPVQLVNQPIFKTVHKPIVPKEVDSSDED